MAFELFHPRGLGLCVLEPLLVVAHLIAVVRIRIALRRPAVVWTAGGAAPYTPPGKLTWNLRIDRWKTMLLYNPVVLEVPCGPLQGSTTDR